jgi:hypothetical protein
MPPMLFCLLVPGLTCGHVDDSVACSVRRQATAFDAGGAGDAGDAADGMDVAVDQAR